MKSFFVQQQVNTYEPLVDNEDEVFEYVLEPPTAAAQGWKFMICSHCQGLGQPVSWLLIGYTRVNNQSEDKSAS